MMMNNQSYPEARAPTASLEPSLASWIPRLQYRARCLLVARSFCSYLAARHRRPNYSSDAGDVAVVAVWMASLLLLLFVSK